MTTNTVPAAGTYALDPGQTVIRCDCKAMFGAFTVHGTFTLSQGQVSIDASPPDGPVRGLVRAVIDARSYCSGNTMRDADVHSAVLLDSRSYPQITFTGSVLLADGGWTVDDGSVTAHGVTRPVPVRITQVQAQENLVRFRAAAGLDRTGFGITGKKGMVGRAVAVVIDAVAVPLRTTAGDGLPPLSSPVPGQLAGYRPDQSASTSPPGAYT